MSEPLYELTIYRNLRGEKYSGPHGPVRVLAPHRRTLLSRSGALRRLDLPWVALGEVLRLGGDSAEQVFVGFQEDPRDGETHAMSVHVWHGGRVVGRVCLGKRGGDVWSSVWSDDSLGLTAHGATPRAGTPDVHSLLIPTDWPASLRRLA